MNKTYEVGSKSALVVCDTRSLLGDHFCINRMKRTKSSRALSGPRKVSLHSSRNDLGVILHSTLTKQTSSEQSVKALEKNIHFSYFFP